MNKKIKFRVNGKKVEVDVPTNRLLIDCLRYDLGLTGTKEGCSVAFAALARFSWTATW